MGTESMSFVKLWRFLILALRTLRSMPQKSFHHLVIAFNIDTSKDSGWSLRNLFGCLVSADWKTLQEVLQTLTELKDVTFCLSNKQNALNYDIQSVIYQQLPYLHNAGLLRFG